MKKILLLAVTLLSVMLLPAQGIYQQWGLIPGGGANLNGVIFNTDNQGNNFKLIHQFGANEGANPVFTKPIFNNGKFYGVTSRGGLNDIGVIFEWDPVTNIYSKKYDFEELNGYFPEGSLTLMQNKFYGMTLQGGLNNKGVIFEWDPATNIYTKRIDLDADKGSNPHGSLTQYRGKLYGMTSLGGTNDKGVIFEWDPATNIYTKKTDFSNTGNPFGSLTLLREKFYGLASGGGSIYSGGVIFEWDPITSLFINDYTFRNDGYSPYGDLTLKDGKFYGMTSNGGNNYGGVIFEWNPATNVYIKKFDFDGQLDEAPLFRGSLTLNAGKLYGITYIGGSTGNLVIFEWNSITNTFKIKYDFDNGYMPGSGSLTLQGGKLYGMTGTGGSNDVGVMFVWDPANNEYTKKIDFSGSDDLVDGGQPNGSLAQYKGKLYGLASAGGKYGKGVIFEIDPATNVYTKKYDFDAEIGDAPVGRLILNNGKFYGMTNRGGNYGNDVNGYGVIFEWDPVTNVYTKKIDFDGINGYFPYGSLTLFGNKFYGMTSGGGNAYAGVIFEWNPVTNIYTKKIDLTEVSGFGPTGSLTVFENKFYGLTTNGGINNDGTINDAGVIFEWDPITNQYSKKIDFRASTGKYPRGTLTKHNGKFYGITERGGINDAGVIFEWDPVTNAYTKKFDFGGINGVSPVTSLTGSGNKLYGLTHLGGTNNYGVLFEWDPVTNVYTKKINFNGLNGASPNINNDLVLIPALVSDAVPGSCATFPSITINNSNNNQWVSIVDDKGNAVAEIKANGNSLGIVTTSIFINNTAVREDSTGRLYLDRSITITPQFPQKTAIDIRLYIKGSEYNALRDAHNSFGQTAGIKSINDVGIFKIRGNCQPGLTTLSNLISTNGAAWENDYVLSASINSFTSFYFGSKNPCAAPVISAVSASPALLSPADHQMKTVTFSYSAKGNCFPITTWLTITSNEAVSGTGNGDLSPDWIILDDHHVQLRSERSDGGTGRIYTITVNARNAFNTYCKKLIKVTVPYQPSGLLSKTADVQYNQYSTENELFDCSLTPNPSGQYFNLLVGTSSNEKIEVILLDMSGRLMSKMNTLSNQTLHFGNELRPGVYIIKIIQGHQQKTIKAIKQ